MGRKCNNAFQKELAFTVSFRYNKGITEEAFMIDFILLFATVCFVTMSKMVYKSNQQKNPESGALLFSAFCCIFACIFFLCSGGFKFEFNSAIMPYVISFGASYGTATVATYFAIKTGSLSLTSLITSYSLVVPTVYGLLFLGEDGSILFYVGLVLLLISLMLIGMKGDKKSDTKTEDKPKITPIWVLFVSLAFIGNGLCSTFQTAEQRAFMGAYKSELMILSLLIVSLTLFVMALIFERDKLSVTLKKSIPFAFLYGMMNGAVNLFVMMLTGSGRLSAAVIFPTISGGGIITTALVGIFIYREKLTKWQDLSLILGTTAVVLMNL